MRRIKETIKFLTIIFFPTLYKKRLYSFLSKINWNNIPAEECELLLMKYFLSKDAVFFDIGANTGIYTFNAEKLIAPHLIYAFEPIPELFFRLKRMFMKSNIYKLALSDETSEKMFKIPTIEGHEYKSRGTLNIDYRENKETKSRLIKVKSKTLDNFVFENNIKGICFIKIDVEGHELKVIEGGTETLKKELPVMQIEIEQRHYKQDIKEIIDFIVNLGYMCYYLDPASRSLKMNDFSQELQNEKYFKTSHYINNFIFVPDNKEWATKVEEINRNIAESLTQLSRS